VALDEFMTGSLSSDARCRSITSKYPSLQVTASHNAIKVTYGDQLNACLSNTRKRHKKKQKMKKMKTEVEEEATEEEGDFAEDEDEYVTFWSLTSKYKKSCLLATLLETIYYKTSSEKERLKCSALYRLSTYFKYESSKFKTSFQHDDVDLCDYIEIVSQRTVEDFNTKGYQLFNNLDQYVVEAVEAAVANATDKKRLVPFWVGDIKCASLILRDMLFKVGDRMLLKGTKFKGRGDQYEEVSAPIVKTIYNKIGVAKGTYYVPSNRFNEKGYLLRTFDNRGQYSSWCKYRIRKSTGKKYADSLTLLYGQINYCMQIISHNISSYDTLLEGEIIVSICGRHLEKGISWKTYPPYDESRLPKIKLDPEVDSSYHGTKIFINANDVYGTPVGLVGLNRQSIPFSMKDKEEVIQTDIVTILLIDLKDHDENHEKGFIL
jgi:hypothetical protein